ncbi:MAG: ABC transporter ATP-binding protein [Nocardioides sp.]|uniref:ABC transporter ATP-binding protein n=1 Tax=Nocardioides sp. TaxID=35761 RepID=UPI0039E4E3FA
MTTPSTTTTGATDAGPASAASGRRTSSRSAAAAAIELSGVTRTYGKVVAVDNVDLSIEQGEVVAFLGPNGAGKTSTIDMMLGLASPNRGEVALLGMRPRAAIERGLVSAVMQTGGLLKDLSVRETVAYMASVFANTQAVDDVLRGAGIAEIADRKVGKCSGGEQQRLRFALALLPDPAVLLLDEPTTGMDVEGRRSFWSAIREDAERGRTVVFATHYLEEADQYADRIVLISHGRIVADGSGAEIKALASGRTIRATLTDAESYDLHRLPGVDSVEVRGDTVLIHSRASDDVARHLLSATPARDLEITAQGLEEAFLSLTGDARSTADDANETESLR